MSRSNSIRHIEPFQIAWAEEPLPPYDIKGYAELRRRSPVAISAGEAHCSVHDFKQLIDARALDIVQPPLTGGGGFGEMKAVAQLAQMNNLRVSLPCWGSAIALNAAIHFAASLPSWPHTENAPYPMMVEFDVGDNPLRERLVHDPVQPEKGKLPVPREPGLGLRLQSRDRGSLYRVVRSICQDRSVWRCRPRIFWQFVALAAQCNPDAGQRRFQK